MTEPDDLGAQLEALARTIDVGAPELDAVRSTARRRRLRMQLASGFGVVALVAGATVAVVAVNSGDEPDSLVTAEVEEPDESSDTSVPSPGSTIGSSEAVQPIAPAAQTVEVLDRPGAVGQAVGVGGAPEYGDWSVPWQDGFLVGSQTFPPQPLPDELPEEVRALFPPEVIELFDGELPPTISEAMEMLREAGLLEVVTDIIAENPEASEAIYSAETTEGPTLDVRFTTDGVDWEPIEMVVPPGANQFSSMTAVGDRLVVSYGSMDPFTGRSGDGTVSVATTTDLVEWTVQEINVPPPPVELPDNVSWSAEPITIAANESGWVANVYAGIGFDPMALVPDDVRAEFEQSTDGYSVGSDEIGILVERFDGDETVTVTYSWEELGIAPDVAAYLNAGDFRPEVWASDWSGTPARADAEFFGSQMLATSAGFVVLDDQVRYSPDGITWTATELPGDESFAQSAFVFDGGIVALIGAGPDGQFYRFDETGGSPELLDIPGRPMFAQGAFPTGGRVGLVFDAADPGPPPPPFVVEHEGYRLTIDNQDGSAEVVEIATGEVVADGSMAGGPSEDSAIQFDIDGITVTDPATREEIVVFPDAVLNAAQNQVDGPDEFQDFNPDTWLLATADGERFVLDDLDDGSDGEFFGVGASAANGTRLLVQNGRNWVMYDLG